MRDKLNDKTRLELILEAISNIESFTEDTSSYDAFAANKILCHAVTYNLQCIGENVFKLSKDFIQEHPETDWQAIAGLRHVLVHDYYQVNMEMVWVVLQQDLPGLKGYVRAVLQNDPL